jgi:hypothetical protein
MTFHTKRSPSQAKRFLECNGALALCASLDPIHQNVSGVAAQIGTCVHKLIEVCLQEHKDPESFRGRLIELEGDEENAVILRKGAKVPKPPRVVFEVDADMIDGADTMLLYVRSRVEELGVTMKRGDKPRAAPIRLPERDDTSGTADVTIDCMAGPSRSRRL